MRCWGQCQCHFCCVFSIYIDRITLYICQVFGEYVLPYSIRGRWKINKLSKKNMLYKF